jgi:hypothetical protein
MVDRVMPAGVVAVLWLVAAPWMIAWRSDDEERYALWRAAGSSGIRALFAR